MQRQQSSQLISDSSKEKDEGDKKDGDDDDDDSSVSGGRRREKEDIPGEKAALYAQRKAEFEDSVKENVRFSHGEGGGRNNHHGRFTKR